MSPSSAETTPSDPSRMLADLLSRGEYARLVESARALVAAAPGDADGRLFLGIGLNRLGRLDEAAAVLAEAQGLDPGRADLRIEAGRNELDRGRPEAAVAACRQAIAIAPDLPDAHLTLSLGLSASGRHLEALAVIEGLLAARPEFALAHMRRASVLRAMRRLDESVRAYDEALRLAPDLLADRNAMIDALRRTGEAGQALYYVNCDPRATAADILALAQRCASALARNVQCDDAWPNAPDPERPIRVGLVSPDFIAHPVSIFLEAFLRAAVGPGIAWYAYASVWREDDTTRALRPLFAGWRDIHLQTDAEAALQIRADRIDILIDLAGPTSDSRLGIFARKPAPVQATWLGYVGTTGLPTVDYIIGDAWLFPEGEASGTVEAPWRLPECYMCFSEPKEPIDPGPLPADRNGTLSFGSFNNLNKVNDEVLQLWARVLAAVPDARLRLRTRQFGRVEARERISRRLVELGVDAGRLDIDAPLPTREEGLRAYRDIDIALDTFPYTGATTSAEALWMGVPVLALRGDRMLSRVGESLNQAAGLADWIAADADDYVRKAAAFAADRSRLRALRAGLRARVAGSALGDPLRFAGQFTAALRAMWRSWCLTTATRAPAVASQDARPDDTDRRQTGYALLRNLCDRGDFERLADEARRFVGEFPDHGRAWHLFGLGLLCTGRPADAEQALQTAGRLLPEDGEVQDHLGAALSMSGRRARAAQAFAEAVRLEPARAESWVNAAQNALELGQAATAEAHARQAVALRPDLVRAHLALSAALSDLERHPEALDEADAALRLAPDLPDALRRRGNALRDLRRLNESIEAYDRALVLAPEYAEGWHDMVQALCRAGDIDQAARVAERARASLPDDPLVMSTVASVYALLNRHDEALHLLETLVARRPDIPPAWSKLANARIETGAPLAEIIACHERALALDPENDSAMRAIVFCRNYLPTTSAQEMLDLARRAGRLSARGAEPDRSWPKVADPARTLRVGFVSADFREHPVAFFLDGFLTEAQGKGIEWFAYSAVIRDDDMTRRLKPRFAGWREITLLSDAEAAARVRADSIDILIDLTGFTSDSRLGLFARKPAPVQATWLGYVGTTGLDAVDYIIGDPWLFPEGEPSWTAEKPWRLPECYMSFTAPPYEIDCGEPPLLARAYPTFGCFNNLDKVNDEVLRLWAAVLAAVPEARLKMRAKQFSRPGNADAFRQRLRSCGIDPSRVDIGGALPTREAGLREYADVDIALDPFPYTGATTSAEALWMGVPVLTLRGDRMLSRVGESLNRAVGLVDWIADDRADYVARAARFARDPDTLARLRKGLRNRGSASPLGNPQWFANQFTTALRAMWRQWCAAQ